VGGKLAWMPGILAPVVGFAASRIDQKLV